jgi:hypothetical protein
MTYTLACTSIASVFDDAVVMRLQPMTGCGSEEARAFADCNA